MARTCVVCKAETDEPTVTIFIAGDARPADLCTTHIKPIRKIYDHAYVKPPEYFSKADKEERTVHRVIPID